MTLKFRGLLCGRYYTSGCVGMVTSVTTKLSENFRCYLHGKLLDGGVMTRDEVAALEATISANIEAGLADGDGELIVEEYGRNGWYIKRIRSWDPPIFDREADHG